jgi:hypothetical protein
MFRRTIALVALFLVMLAAIPAHAAGPMGHYIIARKIISNITSGRFQAPTELKQALRDADCQRAYCGGAIGPDLVEGKSHYGATADLSMKLLTTARADLKKAAAAKDAKAFAAAKNELAFAYGWFTHFIVDMNVHEQVNGMTGVTDSYSFTTSADAGHISTDDFGHLRSMVIEINDGKITSDWGKKYLQYWTAIRDLPESQRKARLMELMGKKVSFPSNYNIVLTLSPSSKAAGFNEMPGDWQQPYISVRINIELSEHGEFTFKRVKKDPPGLGHMSTEITGQGTLTDKGELTLEGTTAGGQSYVSQYGNGPDIRFAQADKSKYKMIGSVKFTRDQHNKVYRVDYTQTQFEGSFESKMSRTTLDSKGNDVSTKSATCSGPYSAKGSKIDSIDLPIEN